MLNVEVLIMQVSLHATQDQFALPSVTLTPNAVKLRAMLLQNLLVP
jgi:hypothetical protein